MKSNYITKHLYFIYLPYDIYILNMHSFVVPLGKFQYNSEKIMALLMLFRGSKDNFKKYEVH